MESERQRKIVNAQCLHQEHTLVTQIFSLDLTTGSYTRLRTKFLTHGPLGDIPDQKYNNELFKKVKVCPMEVVSRKGQEGNRTFTHAGH
jgi:hypothetical protein